MFDVIPAIRDRLLTIKAVSDIVGDGVFPDYVPRGSDAPAVVLRPSGLVREYELDGTVATEKHSVAVRCVAYSRTQAVALANAVEGTWRCPADGSADGLNGWTANHVVGFDVVFCELADGEGNTEDIEAVADGSDRILIVAQRMYGVTVKPK